LPYPQFIALHSPTGVIHDAERFLADLARRPSPEDIQIHTAAIRPVPGMATVSFRHEPHRR
jgi:hypothetical protein